MNKENQHSIMVVDDDLVTLKYFQGMFRKMPYTVFYAKNGQEAITKAKKQTIDLAFIDIEMPIMNGFETLIAWKKMQPDTQIIIMSTYNDDETVRRAIKEGAHTYLFKPINRADVFSLVSKRFQNIESDDVITFK
ncbi:MAG: response regulator [Deferribacteres bacterium]|nr:response regulator [candidate division KSB1 bacterium]MCB9501289.1 response regulator [Deferribacteres bacterium]